MFVTDRDVLGGLAVVLEDYRDVHVDDDQEADHEVGQQEGDRHDRVAAVALVTRLGIRCNKKYFSFHNNIWYSASGNWKHTNHLDYLIFTICQTLLKAV